MGGDGDLFRRVEVAWVRHMSVDIPRLVLVLAGLAVGVATYFFAPTLGARAADFNGAVVTVFSILAGIQLAIFALIGGMQPRRFRKGTSVAAAKAAVMGKRWRQYFIFYAYLAVMIMIVINQAFDFGPISGVVERIYVSLSLATLVWSLGLPVALSSIQDDSTSS